MQNHVFLIQAHKEPLLLRRILKRLSAQNHYFCLNIDKKAADYNDFANAFKDIPNIISVTRHNVMHGGFSQVECTLDQLKFAYDYKVKFDFYHTISGQDYPCVDADSFDDVFDRGDISYMMLDSDDELQEWRQQKYPHRMDHWYVMDIFNKPFMCKIHFAGIIRRLIYWVPRKKMDMNLIYGGWNWFSLHRNVIGYLLDFWNDNPKYIARFKYTTSSDELIFSSILYPVADQLKIMKRNSLRYIDWHPKREYTSLPLILDERDFPDIKKSDAVFCRKVDLEHSEKLLNLLDGII